MGSLAEMDLLPVEVDAFAETFEQRLLVATDANPEVPEIDHFTSLWGEYVEEIGAIDSFSHSFRSTT